MFASPRYLMLTVLVVTVAFILRFILFRVSCTLAETPETGMFKALLLVAIVFASTCGAAHFAERAFAAGPEVSGATSVLAQGGGVVLAAIVAALFYTLVLPTTLRRGAVLAGTELLLGLLSAALVAGAILVVLAGAQLLNRARSANPAAIAAPLVRRPAV